MSKFTPKLLPLFSIPLAVLCMQASSIAHEQQLYLSRYVPNLKYTDSDLTKDTKTATYKAIFGEGDKDERHLNAITRVGELTVQPGGASAIVKRPHEEYVLYVTSGKGNLVYGREKAPLKANDFLYIPAGVRHGVSNDSKEPIKVLFMGYQIPEGVDYQPKKELQIANADSVELQVLGSHGPTTQYKLLMGDTASTRDRLASASQMKSLFIMDFAPRGTNNPHRHDTQEEVYFVLQGSGYMVAGLDEYGNVERHPSQEGDAFFWAAGTEVGFYSLNKENEEHSIILAIRSDDPTKLDIK
ncbi:MAG: cupin domain-containing protein [Verrucomicrobia bacterium]|nr:cupin domain-containing protein [Verrucomicrobiota bacterium]MDA1068945.1 cupin domain-containing protein [Verrucomicrobiota bacterium]